MKRGTNRRHEAKWEQFQGRATHEKETQNEFVAKLPLFTETCHHGKVSPKYLPFGLSLDQNRLWATVPALLGATAVRQTTSKRKTRYEVPRSEIANIQGALLHKSKNKTQILEFDRERTLQSVTVQSGPVTIEARTGPRWTRLGTFDIGDADLGGIRTKHVKIMGADLDAVRFWGSEDVPPPNDVYIITRKPRQDKWACALRSKCFPNKKARVHRKRLFDGKDFGPEDHHPKEYLSKKSAVWQ